HKSAKMCTGFLKVMMFIFNGAIFLCGIAGLGVGIWQIFFSIMLIIFFVEVAGAIVLFVFTDVVDELFEELEDDVKTAIQSKYGNPNDMTTLWDTAMKEFRCCGYKNYTDFDGSPFNQLKGEYPGPCCGTPDGKCSLTEVQQVDIPGCFTKLVTVLEDNSFIIAGVAFGIAAIEIAAMVVSMVLYCNAGKKS
ncbi:PREDICTED: tetraspanin-1-like, partial [Cyprinodon variegatus]|uniref:tetraspanin-1-like n=1 Tax=Cyprinodon variegatus TaxID=28743 RepID=UPI000742C21C